MSKYEPLARYLSSRSDNVWEASFCDVERVLGADLPRSAYQFPAWWANQSNQGHSQTQGWISAGWRTSNLDLMGRKIRFEKDEQRGGKNAAMHSSGNSPRTPADVLFDKAKKLTGIADREQLVGLALEQLIASLAATRLAGRGGTMPDLEVPGRERPTP